MFLLPFQPVLNDYGVIQMNTQTYPITFNLPADIMAKIYDFAHSNEICVDEVGIQLATSFFAPIEENDSVEDDSVINSIVEAMLNHAIESNKFDRKQEFKANELYFHLTTHDDHFPNWSSLASSSRKAIGKRFKAAILNQAALAAEGDLMIMQAGKNINGSALYTIVNKS